MSALILIIVGFAIGIAVSLLCVIFYGAGKQGTTGSRYTWECPREDCNVKGACNDVDMLSQMSKTHMNFHETLDRLQNGQ